MKIATLVNAACKLGVIENTNAGRRAYADWLRRDPKAAQAPLARALPQSTRGKATASSRSTTRPPARISASVPPNAAWSYPASWGSAVKAAEQPSGVRTAQAGADRRLAASVTPNTPYPPSMLTSPSAKARVVEANGGTPIVEKVHAMGDTAAYIESQRADATAALAASQQSRTGHHD
ncbi:MAG TPA: hypothetical protein VF178_08370, partial [Gemmatimonadaceae bacterium]